MNKQQILSSLFNIFSPIEIQLVILYGRFSGRDIDLLVILKDQSSYNNISINNLDINYFGQTCLREMLDDLDHILTEPLLTGIPIYGQGFSQLLVVVKDAVVDKNISIYHWQQAQKCVFYAAHFLSLGDQLSTLINLSFASGYIAFARYYCRYKKVITMAELIETDFAKELILIRRLLKSKTQFSQSDLLSFFHKIQEIVFYSSPIQ